MERRRCRWWRGSVGLECVFETVSGAALAPVTIAASAVAEAVADAGAGFGAGSRVSNTRAFPAMLSLGAVR